MTESTTIGQYIRECRAQIGMTLTEFAKRLNLSKSFVSDIERGNKPVTVKRLAQMARIISKSNFWQDNELEGRWLTLYHIMLKKADLMSPALEALKKIEVILDGHSKKKQKLFDIMNVVNGAYFDDLMKIELERGANNDT